MSDSQPARVGLSFEHLNLRFNPFGALDAERRARVAILPPLELEPGEVLQVLGEEGRGKSTRLLTWHYQAPGSGYEYIPEGEDRLKTRTLCELFFVDEAQRLRAVDLERLFARVARLVLATHEDLSRRTTRPVRSMVVAGLDAERLTRILGRRIEEARRGGGAIPTIGPRSVARLLERFGDDLRTMEEYLYEVFQALEGPGHVEV